jgi:CheY-like chemotaxis protein
MNAATRKKVLAYAIPVDLVILATGSGLVVPHIPPLALIALYVVAVAVSAWKSGWTGALAAIVISSVLLFVLFRSSVQGPAIGWFVAASLLVSFPLGKWSERRRIRNQRVERESAPPVEPEVAVPRTVEETAAAALFGEDHAVVSEARAERERIAATRLETEKRRNEQNLAGMRAQVESELKERFERHTAGLQSAFERERAAWKAKSDAALAERNTERAALQKQLDEERRRPAVIEKHVDEEAIAQRLEHLRAELQQQFERNLRTRADAELAAQRLALERDSAREIEKVRQSAEERVATFRAELERIQGVPATATVASSATPPSSPEPPAPPSPRPPAPKRGFLSGFFTRKAPVGETTATRRAAAAAALARSGIETSAESSAIRRAKAAHASVRKPRVLFLESRRATADTAAPRLKQLGIDIVIVERLIDAIDEIHRFPPDVLFLDADHADFEKAYNTISGQAKSLPLVLTSRNGSNIPSLPRAGVVIRPYDIDEVVELVRASFPGPQPLMEPQINARPDATQPAVPAIQPAAPPARERYDIFCYHCGVVFDATDADWCSCLTRDRTVVCTNCLTCFCKATPSYRETFWMNAPPRFFERKDAESRRKALAVAANLPPAEVKRPLVMLVDDEEEIQAIMQRVCANLGYGSVSAANGDDGLDLARYYRPDLILSEAVLPKRDGREMCRLLKEEPIFAGTKMVVMTGLYADIQYKNEAIKRFLIDDYLAKPVSITDLINLLQRYLEGVADLPVQENLHTLHRKELGLAPDGSRITYEVICSSCGKRFDAARAEWCACAGGDNSLVCAHCGNCFCQWPEYRERFWSGAPAVLFERKMIGTMRTGAAIPNPAPAGVRRPLIALVEDDGAIQLIVRTVASTLGCGFVATSHAPEAPALAHAYRPDLILLDAWATNLDGRELCRQLKAAPDAAQLKAVVMTGRYADPTYRQEAASQFEVDDCIAKPLAVGDVLEVVRKYLGEHFQAASATNG